MKVWDFRKSNIERFNCSLAMSDFSQVLLKDDVDDMCSEFYSVLREAMACIPSTYVTLSDKDKPWMTPVLKTLINKRWNAYRTKQWQLFAHYKIKVKQEIRKAKLIWTQRQMSSSKNVWKVVNEVRGKSSRNNFGSLIQRFGGLGEFLPALQNELNKNFNTEDSGELKTAVNESWCFQLNITDVLMALKKLKLTKSSGSDEIPNRLIKEGAEWLSFPLYHIFVKSVNDRKFPRCWKIADVIPIPKCRHPTISDFRPISLIPVISKIFERLILKSVSHDLLNLFGQNQFAFRKYGSTESALVRIHDFATTLLDDAGLAGVRLTCLDLTKAFDKLQHTVLLNNLLDRGINHGFILWLRSYLSGRTQRLKIFGSYGPSADIPSGVPQGSVIGPVLFAAVMGSLKVSPESLAVIYADDITLVEPVPKNNNELTDNIRAIQKWIKANNMCLNLKKSKQMFVSCSSRQVSFYPDIEVCHNMKILGVIWSSNLSWSLHFESFLRLAAQRLYVLRILKPLLSKEQLASVYNSLIVSLFLYCAPLFISLPQNISQKLEKFNKRVHSLICGKCCKCPLFPPISSLRERRARKFFMLCEAVVSHPLHELVPKRMKNSGHLRLPHIRTSRRHNSFFPSMCTLLNRDFSF